MHMTDRTADVLVQEIASIYMPRMFSHWMLTMQSQKRRGHPLFHTCSNPLAVDLFQKVNVIAVTSIVTSNEAGPT
jgi:hypothetical protein